MIPIGSMIGGTVAIGAGIAGSKLQQQNIKDLQEQMQEKHFRVRILVPLPVQKLPMQRNEPACLTHHALLYFMNLTGPYSLFFVTISWTNE